MATVPSAPGGPSAPPAALKISDFQVLSKLGEGGFGTVLLAKKKSSGKLYALKVLEKRNMRMRGIAERVIAECETLQRIHHPFVVQMHYAFQDRSRVVFVLEHVAGGDLFTAPADRSQEAYEAWALNLSEWRAATRAELDLGLYDEPSLAWAATSFVETQAMIHDRMLFDRATHSWTVDRCVRR